MVLISAVFAVLVMTAMHFIGGLYEFAYGTNTINSYNRARFADFYGSEDLDLVFLGNSHSYCTFDPEIFDGVLSVNSFQLGLPSLYADSICYTLLETLNYQKPEAIVVELYFDMLKNDFSSKQADVLFEVMENEELKKDYIKNVFPLNEKIKRNLNFVRYSLDFINYANHKEQKLLDEKFGLKKITVDPSLVAYVSGEEYYRSKGYTYCSGMMSPDEFDKTNQFKFYDAANYKMSEVQKEYLVKIIEICEENSIKLFFVTAPLANVSLEYLKDYDKIHTIFSDFAEYYSIDYLDFNILSIEQGIFLNDNFRDDAHLNHSGVEIASRYYAEYLKNKIK